MAGVETRPHQEYVEPPQPQGELYYANQLREAIAFDAEMVDEARPQLWAAAERVLGLCINPDDQKAVAQTVTIMDYCVFGRTGDTLPPGLLIYDDGIKEDIVVDPRMGLSGHDYAEISSKIHSFWQRPNTMLLHNSPDKDRVEEALTALINASPEFQFLRSFDQQRPLVEDAPLDSYWRQIREGQIAGDVKRRYGLGTNDQIIPGTAIDLELRHRFQALDSETMQLPNTLVSSSDPFQRVRAYMLPFVVDAYESKNPGKKLHSIDYKEDIGKIAFYNTAQVGTENYDEPDDVMEIVAIEIGKTLGFGGDLATHSFLAKAFRIAAERLFDPRFTTHSYGEAIDDIVEHYVTPYMMSVVGDTRTTSDFQGHSENVALAFIRQPNGDTVGESWQKAYREMDKRGYSHWHDIFRQKNELVSANELLRTERQTLGYVVKHEPSNFRVPLRLLQIIGDTAEYPGISGEEDLIIQEFSCNPGSAPYIPGYRLMSKQGYGNVYGFTVDEAGDPYKRCDIVINEARRRKLADNYRSIGLAGLADHIQSIERLTVAELTAIIPQYAVYPVPNLDYSNAFTSPASIENFGQFRHLISDGKLQVQCTGAASFLQMSLKIAFGHTSSAVTGGNTISGSGRRITGTKHAQTVFVWKGQKYILDATPARPKTITPNNSPLNDDIIYSRKQAIAHAPHLELAGVLLEREIEINRGRPKKTIPEQIADLTSGLTEQLRVSYDLPSTEALYAHLAKQPDFDPSRRVLGLLLNLHKGHLDISEVEPLTNFIDACISAMPDAMRRAKLDHYSVGQLEVLRSSLWQIESIFNEAEAA